MSMDPVRLVADVTSLVLPMASERGMRLLTEYHFPLPTKIDANAMGIRQVLTRLCGHALRHTQSGRIVLLLDYDAGAAQLKFCIRDRAVAEVTIQAQEYLESIEQATRYGAELIYKKLNNIGGEYILSMPVPNPGQIDMIVNTDQLAARQQLVPLPSTLSDKGPEFDDIIDKFVHKLPEMLAGIEATYLAGEYSKVVVMLHNLKGMGGGFGYPQLTELAMKIESLSAQDDYADIAKLISALYQLVHRIRAARPF